MATIRTQRASSFPATPRTYDVFLSFYGKDTRKNFADHLHAALRQKGIIIFRDDEKLKRGEHISQELLRAIQESHCAVILISKRYARSKWCLMKLTKIMEYKREKHLRILPVFYHVHPSKVRKLEDSFAKAFTKHMKDPKVDEDQRKIWRAVLEEVGSLSGWYVHDRHESRVVEEICRDICNGLSHNSPNIYKGGNDDLTLFKIQ